MTSPPFTVELMDPKFHPIHLHKVILFSYFTAGTEEMNEIPRSGKLVTMLKIEVGPLGVQVSKYTNTNSKHIMKVLF
jgi:hypothetical protein